MGTCPHQYLEMTNLPQPLCGHFLIVPSFTETSDRSGASASERERFTSQHFLFSADWLNSHGYICILTLLLHYSLSHATFVSLAETCDVLVDHVLLKNRLKIFVLLFSTTYFSTPKRSRRGNRHGPVPCGT